MKLRGKDVYQLVPVDSFTESQMLSLGLLYSALIDGDALRVYLYLTSLAHENPLLESHENLFDGLNITLNGFEQARLQLEQTALIKVFVKETTEGVSYIYEMLPPKTANQFFADPVISRLYSNRMGKENMIRIRSVLAKSRSFDLSEYIDITKPFDSSFVNDWSKKEEKEYQSAMQGIALKDYTPDNDFDYETFLRNCSETVLPSALRTKENLDIIGNLGMVFGIDPIKMVAHVGHSLTKGANRTFTGLDRNKLYQYCKNEKSIYHNPKQGQSPYDKSPAEFLRSKQHGITKIADADARLLSDLVEVWKLPIPVCNVLVEYVLETANGELRRNAVEKIAASFTRQQIKTAEDALKKIGEQLTTSNKRSTPKVSKAKKETKVPEDAEEREKLLKYLKGDK